MVKELAQSKQKFRERVVKTDSETRSIVVRWNKTLSRARVVLKCRMLEEGKRWIRKEIQQGTHGRPPVDHPDHEHRSCDWASVGCAAVPFWRAEQSSMVQWVIYTAARIKREATRCASCLGFRNLFKHRQFSVIRIFKASVVIWRQRVFHSKITKRCAGRNEDILVFQHPPSHLRERFQVSVDRIGSEVLRAYVKVVARRRVQELQGMQIWRQQQSAHSVTTLAIRNLFKHRKHAHYKAQAALRRWQRAMLLMTCKALFTVNPLDEQEERWWRYLEWLAPLCPGMNTHDGFIQRRGWRAMLELGFEDKLFAHLRGNSEQLNKGAMRAIEQFKKNYSEADRDERWDRYLEWKAKELEQKYL
jgi:hypothetical protein